MSGACPKPIPTGETARARDNPITVDSGQRRGTDDSWLSGKIVAATSQTHLVRFAGTRAMCANGSGRILTVIEANYMLCLGEKQPSFYQSPNVGQHQCANQG